MPRKVGRKNKDYQNGRMAKHDPSSVLAPALLWGMWLGMEHGSWLLSNSLL